MQYITQVRSTFCSKLLIQGMAIGLLMLAVAGCTGSGQSRSSGGNPDLITQEQIRQTGATSNAYTLVQRLRPNWLRKRGRSSVMNPGSILVYVDGSRYGGVERLRALQVTNVESFAFLGGAAATTRFGTGHDHGVIAVTTKGGG